MNTTEETVVVLKLKYDQNAIVAFFVDDVNGVVRVKNPFYIVTTYSGLGIVPYCPYADEIYYSFKKEDIVFVSIAIDIMAENYIDVIKKSTKPQEKSKMNDDYDYDEEEEEENEEDDDYEYTVEFYPEDPNLEHDSSQPVATESESNIIGSYAESASLRQKIIKAAAEMCISSEEEVMHYFDSLSKAKKDNKLVLGNNTLH